jgi:(p)ppGpp synthase/HD superfamily hydrolase
MDNHFKRMTDFFRDVGADDISHSNKSYLAHAIGVHNDMREWGGDEDLCRAALFHSIYGTELFQKFALPLERRDELRELIGERAEQLAYWNCAMDREVFDKLVFQEQDPWLYGDRLTGETIKLSDRDFEDLVRIHICDWLEQVARANHWKYRRDAYRQMAKRLGGIAEESYQRVFADEPADISTAHP